LITTPRKLTRGARLRLALHDLGPIFVKFGQILSTRRDLLPEDIADELALLQDQVKPFNNQHAMALIEKALEQPISELFSQFEEEPLASASIAQVHTATMHDGKDVVVKIIRPGIDKIIKHDISLLMIMARLLARVSKDGRRLRPVEVVADYERTIYSELDLQSEAANTSQLRRNFKDSDALYVPEVYWDYTRTNVMVMERIYGIPVADIAALTAQNTNMKRLAEKGVEIFFTQVFRDSFFHADMHPGNIFISTENPDDPQYIAIDCGIVGSLTTEDQSYLARNLMAFFNQDYYQVAKLHVESGWVPADTKVNEFEVAIRSVLEPVFEKPLHEISFGQVLLRLFQTARRFNMEVQPQLVLLQKTLLNIEGLGRQLYPQLDLWTTAKPYLERWMKDRVGPKAIFKEMKRQAPQWLEQAPHIPQLALDALGQVKSLHDHSHQQSLAINQLQQQIAQQQKANRHRWIALSLIIAAAVIASPNTNLEQLPWYSWALGGSGLLWLFSKG
jgi:ubiquinone biosynthesis protein